MGAGRGRPADPPDRGPHGRRHRRLSRRRPAAAADSAARLRRVHGRVRRVHDLFAASQGYRRGRAEDRCSRRPRRRSIMRTRFAASGSWPASCCSRRSPLPQAADAALPMPEGPVILSVTGNITTTNAEGRADFDRAMLEALGVTRMTTWTPWTDGQVRLRGRPRRRAARRGRRPRHHGPGGRDQRLRGRDPDLGLSDLSRAARDAHGRQAAAVARQGSDLDRLSLVGASRARRSGDPHASRSGRSSSS